MKPDRKRTQEELTGLLNREMSRRNTDLIADLVGSQEKLFDPLFELFLLNMEPVSRRAAWAVDVVTEQKPEWLEGKIDRLVEALEGFHHDGLKRHTLRILARSSLPSPDLSGRLVNICFEWLLAQEEAVSTKVYSMEIIARYVEQEPDLRQELIDSIQWRMEEERAGFKSYAKKLLTRLSRDLTARSRSEFTGKP